MSVWTVINIILIIILAAMLLNMLYISIMMRRSAKQLDEATFKNQMRNQQLIDTRERENFVSGHIKGARNFPYSMLKEVGQSLRHDRPIYLYAQTRSMEARSANLLRKQGFKDIYVLKGGFEQWTGDIKKSK